MEKYGPNEKFKKPGKAKSLWGSVKFFFMELWYDIKDWWYWFGDAIVAILLLFLIMDGLIIGGAVVLEKIQEDVDHKAKTPWGLYVEFDGHQYVERYGQGGICHSPKCWCHTNKVETAQ